jgi:hypothetical protein
LTEVIIAIEKGKSVCFAKLQITAWLESRRQNLLRLVFGTGRALWWEIAAGRAANKNTLIAAFS